MKNIIGFIIGLVLLTGCQKEEVQPDKWWVGNYKIETEQNVDWRLSISDGGTSIQRNGQFYNQSNGTIYYSDEYYILSKFDSTITIVLNDTTHYWRVLNTYKITRDMKFFSENFVYSDGVQVSGTGVNQAESEWVNLTKL